MLGLGAAAARRGDGAVDAPGLGLAALAMATPPTVSRPIARSIEATMRRDPVRPDPAGRGVARVVGLVVPDGWFVSMGSFLVTGVSGSAQGRSLAQPPCRSGYAGWAAVGS